MCTAEIKIKAHIKLVLMFLASLSISETLIENTLKISGAFTNTGKPNIF